MPRPTTAVPFTITTTISVLRVPDPVDPDELRDGADPAPAAEQIDSLVPASVGKVTGGEDRDGGSRQTSGARLVCALTDLTHTDQVLDESTGDVWAISDVLVDERLGLNYLAANLLASTGPR